MTFGERLNYALKLRNKKASDLSRATGLSKSLISQYLNDKFEAKNDKALVIAEYLNVSPLWLMGLSDDVDTKTSQDEIMYKEIGFEFFRLPLYAPICCGNGGFADDNIIEYVAIPSRGLSSPENYFCQIAKGDSMTDAGIDDGDLLVFEKTSQIYSGMIGCFCIDENEAMCKKYSVMNGIIILQPMNSKYEPIAVDPTNECFKCVGVLRKSIKSFNT